MKWLLILLLLLPMVTAQQFYNAESIVMDIRISSKLDLVATDSDYKVEFLKINLSYIPQESTHQTVLSMDTKGKLEGDNLIFLYEDIDPGTYDFELLSRVRSQNRFRKIQESITYPLGSYPKGVDEFRMPAEIIDSDNQDIINQASMIAEGEDDLVELVYKLAYWVRTNVEYSLDTYTADASEKASWVLENRYGVCDEITSLFLAMCRSIGIPARYVSGVAYTNYNDLNDWGPHAWAEVYFPGYGWIPYDVTYGQFGFVDASHIALRYSLDAGQSSVGYTWKGYNIDLEHTDMDIDTKLIEEGDPLPPLVDLDVDLLKDHTGFGSYNLIRVKIKNKNPYYVISTIQYARTTDFDIEGNSMDFIFLRPNEEKVVYRIAKIGSDLRKDMYYEVPAIVTTLHNATSEDSFTARNNDPIYSREDMVKLMNGLDIKENIVLRSNISIDCSSVDRAYNYESIGINCTFTNIGNTLIRSADLCLGSCYAEDLGISQEKQVTFTPTVEEIGERDFEVQAKYGGKTSSEIVTIDILDPPKVKIQSLDAPNEVSYDDQFAVTVTLGKGSYSVPKDVKIQFLNEGYIISEFSEDELTETHNYKLQLKGSSLFGEDNHIKVNVEYKDDNGRKYQVEDDVLVTIDDLNILQKILLWLQKTQARLF